jgi:O-acetyl-ADP-ribose deacetylase (regulator of RNase III)
MTTEIKYLKGDVLYPTVEGNKIIPHVCNTVGAFWAGFVVALSARWKEPEKVYLSKRGQWHLGDVHLIQVEPDIVVANMIAQRALRSPYNPVPLDTIALERCLEKVAEAALMSKASICAPKFGSGYAGGRWETIAHIIERTLCKRDIPVFIYEL